MLTPEPPPAARAAGERVDEAACRSCGDAGLKPFLEVGGGFQLGECARCGLISTLPELSFSEVMRFYPPIYYGKGSRRFNRLFESLIPWFRARRAEALERFVPRGRMLDVGCGRGYLPALLRKRGWDAQGIEITLGAAEHAREVLGVPVHVGTFEDSAFPDASFDALMLWHVLEHLADPVAALRKAHSILRPNGLLVVAVPNYSSIQARLTGRHWFHLDIPRHYHHFRLAVLQRLLQESGFRLLEVSHLVFEQNPYGWFQSLYNVLGFRPNLLYEILKNESARVETHPLRAHPFQAVATAALLPVVGIIGLSLTLLELLLRRGGTIEVYARRMVDEGDATDRPAAVAVR